MADLVRAAALAGYFDLAHQLGVPTAPLLREAGLTHNMLANPEQVVPATAVIALLERTAEVSGCPTFGLRLAERRSLADLGPVSLLIAHQSTLREALEVLISFRNRINATLVLILEEADDHAILREDFSLVTPIPAQQATDLALGILSRLCSTVLGANWQPETVMFTYPAPDPGQRDVYRRVFRCPIGYDAAFNGIVLPAGDLDRVNNRMDPALATHARALFDSFLSTAEQSVAQEVEQTILMLLPSGRATIAACAEALGMNIRTLQRRLDLEEVKFTDILQRVRVQLADRYLANPRTSITDVAGMLGYSSLAAFSRWYRQTYGCPARDARRRIRPVSGPGIIPS